MAFVGAGTASATVLCKNNGSTSACSENYPSATKVSESLVAGTKAVLNTEFKNIECSKSTVSGKTETSGSATETVKGPVEGLTFEECNCEVKVLKTGTLEIHWISGPNNGTVTQNGAEVTVNCSTIFGTVHCIYVTENTDLGTLTGGNPAKVDVKASIPRLTTNSLCSTTATWEASYEVTAPKPLYVTEVADVTFSPSPLVFTELNHGKILKIKNTSGVVINNIGVGIEAERDFEMAKLCNNATLNNLETCEESIQCFTAGAKGQFTVFSANPDVLEDVTLEC